MVATPTSDDQQRVLRVLLDATRPMTAAQIAAAVGMEGPRETVRRRVREIIPILRNQGQWIVATTQSGYWLTHDAETWREYNATRTIDARRILAEASRRQRRAQVGQMMLFDATAV